MSATEQVIITGLIILAILVGVIVFQIIKASSTTRLPTVEEFLSKPCPKEVKSPIYELCQKMVEDVDFLRMTAESYHTSPYTISEYSDTFGVVYIVRWMDCLHNPLGYYTITHIKLPDKSCVAVHLSGKEVWYLNMAWGLREELLKERQHREFLVREQLVRDAVTKLYSQLPSGNS